MQSKEAKEKVDLAISKWLIDASIPFNAANSAYYQSMFDAACSYGTGYKAPNFYDLCGYLLIKNVEQVKNFVDSFRSTWKEIGCTIMADEWTDQERRTLINFLAYCPRGTIFLKSVDALDNSKTADMLYKLFREVVLFVGVEHVVHVVTDNAANYVAVGRLLERKFPTLYWSPCAAHYLNLMLQDVGKLDEDALRAMVTSKEWTLSAYAKESKAKSDERPSMGYLYAAMHKAREELLKRFAKRKKRVDTYLNIIVSRWDNQLHKNVHAAGFWLNPAYQYDSTELEKHRYTTSGLLDVIEKYSYENSDLMTHLTSEMKLFVKLKVILEEFLQ
nr:uncharacterized protein LOC113739175 [Coffea arabica]